MTTWTRFRDPAADALLSALPAGRPLIALFSMSAVRLVKGRRPGGTGRQPLPLRPAAQSGHDRPHLRADQASAGSLCRILP